MFEGAAKRRQHAYELALFQAWHTAAFNNLAKLGKLQDWSVVRAKFLNEPTVEPAQDWRTQQAARKAQMQQLRKHQQQRRRPIRRRHA